MELHTIVLCVILSNIQLASARGGGGHGGGGHGSGHGGGHSGGHGSGGHTNGGHGGSYSSHYVNAHHTHYSYHPPSHVAFTCRYCSNPAAYPVFHGQPPTYVYKYREDNSRFGDLLTGLALYNLGRATAEHGHGHYHAAVPNEKCSLQVRDKTNFEETEFPCMMMSSFLDRAANVESDVVKVPVDITSLRTDVSVNVVDGSPIEITREQECLLWHNTSMAQIKKDIPCALLKVYANTLKPSGVPVYIWFPTLVGIVLTLTICCQCSRRKKEVVEEAPLNQPVVGYCSNAPAPLCQPSIAYCSNRVE